MAFILKSRKLIHSLSGLTRRRVVIGKRKSCVFFESSRNFSHFHNEFHARTLVSLAATDTKEIDDRMLEKSFYQLTKDAQTRNIFLEDVMEVFETVKQRGEVSFSQLILLLKCCSEAVFLPSKKERIKLAEDIWKAAADLGMKFHISHYNALLNVFLENYHSFSPSEFLNILKAEGVEPNVGTYRKLLRAYCQQGDIDGANSILETMKKLEYPLNVDDFNSLILGHCEVGDLDKAADLLKVMEEKDLEPTPMSYALLLCGYAKHKEIEKMENLLNALPEKDILLSDSHLLEIVYTLAVNGETQHIDMILNKLNYMYGKTVDRIIQRLLHENLDSVAFKVLEKAVETENSIMRVFSHSRYILKHFLMYRSPKELLEACDKLERKGWSKTSLCYILKEAFLRKDENYCVELLMTMKDENLEVRNHYYWPAIIKASAKGNSQMFQVLKGMPKIARKNCPYTLDKVVFPNYKFGENWREDYEVLRSFGFKAETLRKCFIEKLLDENKFQDIEDIVSSGPVGRPLTIISRLPHMIQTSPDELERVFRMFNLLAHDFCTILNRIRQDESDPEQTPAEEASEEVMEDITGKSDGEITGKTNRISFDSFLIAATRIVTDENVLLRVLQTMLEKKIAITSDAARSVTASLQNQELIDVVNKLADPDLQFEFDDSLLTQRALPNGSTSERRSRFPRDASDRVVKNTEFLEGTLTPESLHQCVEYLRDLVNQEYYSEAVELAEGLSPNEELMGAASTKTKMTYLSIVRRLYQRGQDKLGERAFNAGLRLGLLQMQNCLSIVNVLFKRGKVQEAVTKYCEFLDKSKNLYLGMQFMARTVASKDDEAIQKLTTKICDHFPESVCFRYLAAGLIWIGDIKKAEKLIKVKNLNIQPKFIHDHCEIMYNFSSSAEIENYIKFTKGLEDFDRVPLYKMLLQKFAEEGDVEKAKNLWIPIVEDDIMDYDFLEEMRDFTNSPTEENLKKLAHNFSQKRRSQGDSKEGVRGKRRDQALKGANSDNTESSSLVDEPRHLASKRNAKTKKGAQEASSEEKIREQLDFLSDFAKNGKFGAIEDCIQNLTYNDSLCVADDNQLFEQFKSLAILCHENNVSKPLISFFVRFIRISSRRQDVEEIFEKYSELLKSVPFSTFTELTKPFDALFYENLISSDKLRSHYSDSIHLIYSEIILAHCAGKRSERALKVLNAAVADGFKNEITEEAISALDKLLTQKGVDFPYPELLAAKS